MSFTKFLVSLAAAVLLAGCAHPISVAPDIDKIAKAGGARPQTARVGYYIPPELEGLEVTTPGGGGDNVRYFPYREIEPGFARVLSNVFPDVVKLRAAPVFSGPEVKQLDYIIQPQLVTNSGNSGPFTWPPDHFSVDLTSTIYAAANGTVVASPRVHGAGTAQTSERVFDHGFAGRRAMEDALMKMQALLEKQGFAAKANAPTRTASLEQVAANPATARLAHLKELLERGLVSQSEYDAKRKDILDSL